MGTWQSLPELSVEPGDFTTDASESLHPTINQDCEGEKHSEIVINVKSPHGSTRVNNRVTFSDERDVEIHSNSLDEYNA